MRGGRGGGRGAVTIKVYPINPDFQFGYLCNAWWPGGRGAVTIKVYPINPDFQFGYLCNAWWPGGAGGAVTFKVYPINPDFQFGYLCNATTYSVSSVTQNGIGVESNPRGGFFSTLQKRLALQS